MMSAQRCPITLFVLLAWGCVSVHAEPLPPAATAPLASVSALAADQIDPISRFLVDNKVLEPGPVAELAQQARGVKDRAAGVASDLVFMAMNFLGVPYRLGGTSEEDGFDCSGFTRHVFENSVGMMLPRRAAEQARSPDLVSVKQAELKPGDLVFFNTLRRTFSHVGIYIGDNKFIHSPRAGAQVRVEDLRVSYWQKRFDGARRAPAILSELPVEQGAAKHERDRFAH